MPKTTTPVAPEQKQVADFSHLLEAERALLQKYQLQDLPEEDEVPLESYYHRLQIGLLHELVYQRFKDRTDYFCGGNMFLYYDLLQAEGVIQYVLWQRPRAPYKGPDFFVVLGGVDGAKDRKHSPNWKRNSSNCAASSNPSCLPKHPLGYTFAVYENGRYRRRGDGRLGNRRAPGKSRL
jgi:hypothetical protein